MATLGPVEGNERLSRRMTEAGYKQVELAEKVNAFLTAGCRGTISDRTVRNWLRGETRWPHPRHREALEELFGCTAEELGFIPPPPVDEEDPARRRDFVVAATGTAVAAAVPAQAAPKRVGLSDVERLQEKFAAIIATDHRVGGRISIETQAQGLAGEALALQSRGTASQRTRGALYATAASFISSAMWAAIDGKRFEAAQRHHDRASSLAAMSGDVAIQFRIWSHAGSLYRHLGRPTDALAANDVARGLPIARRDPLFASLGHARHAAIHGLTGDAAAVRRSLGYAEDSLERAAENEPRPVWMTAFYDRAELDGLAVAAHLSLGQYEDAEARAHRSLAGLRPYMNRSRAITTARLARAQLGQGSIEAAVATAMTVPAEVTAHPRVAGMLSDFRRRLHRTASGSTPARTWDEYAHDDA
ncbi:helix-turn-helix transcriptional regulator [Streptomyces sp. ISL-11]|uniref:helix-turn-helix domain-containing protein n=1 Tax=Streptomyces sp. ISL-11 TaxID=2819174 RepID=UPI0027E51426|nr:helix-turn-helix transcriptional regulator [Streptomyces sp. ISL-11]